MNEISFFGSVEGKSPPVLFSVSLGFEPSTQALLFPAGGRSKGGLASILLFRQPFVRKMDETGLLTQSALLGVALLHRTLVLPQHAS